VHVVAPAATIAALVQAEPDVQTSLAEFEGELPSPVGELLGRADAVVVGPGLGRAPGRTAFVRQVRAAIRAPLVLDADGLIAFAGKADELAGGGPIVITPHAGEFRALFPTRAADLGVDPWGRAIEAAATIGGVVLLKGVPTVVARPGQPLLTVAAGNPGLASGGSGDLLSGIFAAALARELAPEIAAALGAQILGRAADLAARRVSARSLRPMDVLAALPDLWREWEVLRVAGQGFRPPVIFELPRPQTV